MRSETRVTLPGGFVDEAEVVHREVVLRQLCGRDEAWLHALTPQTRVARVATELLLRGVRRIGPYRATRALVRALAVGDRDYLLLKLREQTFGAKVERVSACPRCAAKIDIDFSLERLPIAESPARARYAFQLGAEGDAVEFRLPCGSDLEAVSDVDALLARCVLCGGDVRAWSPERRDALAGEIERVAASLPSELELACPECAHVFALPFDAASEVLHEFERRRAELDNDIHLVSLHYHWPLREILALTRAERRHYVGVLRVGLEAS